MVHAPTLLASAGARRARSWSTIHDAVPWTHPETLTPRGVRWHRAMAERAAEQADAIVVPTRAVADELDRHLAAARPGRRWPASGVSGRLALPADADERARRLAPARRSVPAEPGDAGAAQGPRRPHRRAGAARRRPTSRCSWSARPGGAASTRRRTPRAAGLSAGRVRALGRLSDSDLAVVLARATALVVPSRAEGFGLPVLEAMAAGTAVVTSDAPALVEVGGGATCGHPGRGSRRAGGRARPGRRGRRPPGVPRGRRPAAGRALLVDGDGRPHVAAVPAAVTRRVPAGLRMVGAR